MTDYPDHPETFESSGPIQLLAVAFPGSRFKGEILPALDRLKERGIVRVIDALMIRKDTEGRTLVAKSSDLDWEEATAFGAYLGSLTGFVTGGVDGMETGALAGAAELADGHIFDDDDIFRLTQALGPDMTAAFILIQHTWASEFLGAVAAADGVELLNEWIRPEAVLTLDAYLEQHHPSA